jgi:predicted dehydrogenase
MLFRLGTHLVDTVNFFVESEPEWVVAALDDGDAAHPPRYAGDGGRDPALDPGCSAIVQYRSGVRAFLNLSKGNVAVGEWDVIGDKGRLRLGPFVHELWQQLDDGQIVHKPLFARVTTRSDLAAAVDELIGLVENGGTGSSTGEDGRRTVSILLGILQSSARGGARVGFPVADA